MVKGACLMALFDVLALFLAFTNEPEYTPPYFLHFLNVTSPGNITKSLFL